MNELCFFWKKLSLISFFHSILITKSIFYCYIQWLDLSCILRFLVFTLHESYQSFIYFIRVTFLRRQTLRIKLKLIYFDVIICISSLTNSPNCATSFKSRLIVAQAYILIFLNRKNIFGHYEHHKAQISRLCLDRGSGQSDHVSIFLDFPKKQYKIEKTVKSVKKFHNGKYIPSQKSPQDSSLCLYLFHSKNNFQYNQILEPMFPNQQCGSYFTQNYCYQPLTPNYLLNGDIFEQINSTLATLNQRQRNLMNQVESIRNQMEKFTTTTIHTLSAIFTQQCNKHMQKIKKSCEQNCFFKKDQLCPVKACKKKYSSRIALRAHMRRKHSKMDLQNLEPKS